jgi:hypothetical protein
MRLVGLAMIAAACGGGGDGAGQGSPAPVARPIATVAPAAGAGDVIVAKVAGRPVWGSCVAAQISRGATDKADALDQCIAFELMAQEAEARGMVPAASADEAVRRALVNRLVELGFEATHTTPESLGDVMTKWLDANTWRMHRPELRASTYARVPVAKGASAEADAAAKALAEKVAAAVANETGLFGVNLRETATRISAGSGLTVEAVDVKATQRSRLDPVYGDALYALPEVGRASGAVRTPWGWDVVVWTGGLPPQDMTREQMAESAFPELRRLAFGAWVNGLIKDLHVTVTIDQAQVAKLEGGSS